MKNDIELGRSWKCLLNRDRDHLRWCTIIIGAIRIRESEIGDSDRVGEIGIQVSDMVDGFRRSWLGITRGRQLRWLLVRGAFEIDLRRSFTPDGHHHATLVGMGCDAAPLDANERFLIVHVHFVTLFPDEVDGDESADALRHVVQNVWTAKWQTQVKGLYVDPPVDESIQKLYSYTHKRRLEYSTGGMGDVPTKFGEKYEWIWSKFVLKMYSSFNSEFRSKR